MFTSSLYPQPYSFAPVLQQKPIPTPITSLTAKNPLVSQLKIVLEDKLKKAQNKNPSKDANVYTAKESTLLNRGSDESGVRSELNESQNGKNVPYPIKKQKIFAPAGKAYFILNSLFQTFKKHNQFRLLQQKVHQIEVYHDNDEHKISQQFKSIPQTKNSPSNTQQNQSTISRNRVKPQTIFMSHEGELSGKEIEKFIEIEGFIGGEAKDQLVKEIVKSISSLKDVKQIMRCYQKLFTTRYCRESIQMKEMVEEKMIKKILTLDFKSQNNPSTHIINTKNHSSTSNHQHPSNPFNQIGHSLLGFPKITQNILYLIGLLFDKVPGQQLQLYDLLYQIMKRNLSFNPNNLQEALTNINNKKQIQALMKVNTKENNDLIKSLLRAYAKIKEKNTATDHTNLINIPKIAENQAHCKLVKLMAEEQQLASLAQSLSLLQLSSNPQSASIEQQPPAIQPLLALPPQPFAQPPLTPKEPQIIQEIKLQITKIEQQTPICPKTQSTLKFITEVIKSGSNIWQQVNEWLKMTTSQNSKSFLINEISLYLDRCLNDDRKFKNYILPHIKIISKDLEQNSQVYRLWLRQLLKPITNEKTLRHNYLKFNIVKKFILKGITNSQNIPIFVDDLFNPSLLHSELLYDVFTFEKEKAFTFYKQILENQQFSKYLFALLIVLKEKNPTRLKEWLIQADQIKGGELFLCSRSVLIQFIKNHVKMEVAFNWIRDLALYPPSKYLVWILISFISVHKQKKQNFQALRTCIARTINMILVRNPVNKLCDEFKKHLPNLAREFTDFNDEYQIMFADVSAETQAQLKRVHKESQGIKF